MRVNGRNLWRVSYTHPSRSVSPGQSPARLVRYVSRRPLDRARPGPEATWETLPEGQMFGDAEAFRESANLRARERIETAERRGKDLSKNKALSVPSYLHVVLSPDPERSGEYGDEDFRALVEEWTRGEDASWFAAVHYDEEEHPHCHLMIARDRYRPADLEEKLNDADRAAAVRELGMGFDLDPQVRERLGWALPEEIEPVALGPLDREGLDGEERERGEELGIS